MSSVNNFLELKCAGDVLNSVYPFLNPEKEISESMVIIKKIKKILLTNPNHYNIFDLCSGNCLTSSLIAHLFKIKKIFAVDKKDRIRANFSKINNFENIKMDIINDKSKLINLIKEHNQSIIVSVHPCDELAQVIIKIYKETKADYLIMMPCCEGKKVNKYPSFIVNKLSPYELWCLDLCNLVNGEASVNNQCMSEKNIVIVSKKENLDESKK
jgi:hypothetical protein